MGGTATNLHAPPHGPSDEERIVLAELAFLGVPPPDIYDATEHLDGGVHAECTLCSGWLYDEGGSQWHQWNYRIDALRSYRDHAREEHVQVVG